MMRFLIIFMLLLPHLKSEEPAKKFRVIEFIVDITEKTNLCVYQAEIQFDKDLIQILSIESGETSYFSEAPFYSLKTDPKGILSIGSFRKEFKKNTTQKFKLFRVHVLTSAKDLSSIQIIKLLLADENGNPIKGTISPMFLEEKK